MLGFRVSSSGSESRNSTIIAALRTVGQPIAGAQRLGPLARDRQRVTPEALPESLHVEPREVGAGQPPSQHADVLVQPLVRGDRRRLVDVAVCRDSGAAFRGVGLPISNATSYGRRSSVMPSSCVASTTRPDSSTQPVKPVRPLVESVEMRQARTVSGLAPPSTALSLDRTRCCPGTTNTLSACTVRWTSRGAIAIGSNIGSVSRPPAFGRSPSETASGNSVGRSTGPGRRMWCVSACVGEVRTTSRSSVSPTICPDASIGISPASICILNCVTRSFRVRFTSVRAVARRDSRRRGCPLRGSRGR